MKQKEKLDPKIKKKKAVRLTNLEILEDKIIRIQASKKAAMIARENENKAIASGARYRQLNHKTWVLEKMN